MLRTGVDVIEIERIQTAIDRHGSRFLTRVYTARELTHCQERVESLAGRFAAKEAFMKALGTGWSRGVKFSEIEIHNLESGQPVIEVYGQAKEFCQAEGIGHFYVSLSHLRTLAIATVILEK